MITSRPPQGEETLANPKNRLINSTSLVLHDFYLQYSTRVRVCVCVCVCSDLFLREKYL